MASTKTTTKSSTRRRRRRVDHAFQWAFRVAGWIAAIMVLLIMIFVISKGVTPFLDSHPEQVEFDAFMTGMRWRADQNVYGIGFIMINTLIVSLTGGLLALPFAILTALLITRIAKGKVSIALTTVVETLAAIPSVIYGVFAASKITELVRDLGNAFGIATFGGNSSLAVILLLAIMVFPTMTTLAISGMRAVPTELSAASLALGATPTQTSFKVVVPAARSAILTGFTLGLGRAFGEATAVSMIAGNALSGPSWNPFDITRTLTSTMLTGLHETTGIDYDIRFSVGSILLIFILIMNALVHTFKRRIERRGGAQ
ncbi:MAG: phosphate ABC transporter permease subunit PstC [Saccharofermentanales bacterium]